MSGSSFLALGCVGAISSAFPAYAQATPAQADTPSTNLGGVTVTDTAITEGSYKTDKLDSPKYTAPLIDTPRSITVIGSQVIKDTASATLAEALRTVPGITMGAGEGGNPLGDRPFIRGFDSQNSTYLDGVRDIGAQTRETFDVDSIEVVKGSDSVTNGSGNAGGSINLVSKLPTSERFIEAEGTYGSADYKRGTIDINQPINEFVGVRLNAMYHDQNVAGRDAIFQKRWGVAPSVKIGLTGPTSLTVSYYHLHTNELPDAGTPYTYTLANAPAGVTETAPVSHYTTLGGQEIDVPRGAFYGLKDRDFRHTNVNDFTIRAQHEFDNGFMIRNTSRYSHTEQDYIVSQPDDQQGDVYGNATGTAANAGGYVWRRANTRYGYSEGLINQTDLTGKFDTGSVKHSIAGGLEYSHLQSAFGTFVSNAQTGTALSSGATLTPRCTAAAIAAYYCTPVGNPNPNDPWVSTTSDLGSTAAAIQKSLPITQTLSHSTTYAASLFDTITLTDWLLVNLGGRYDHYSTSVSAGLAATSTAARTWGTKKNNIWTYQAGVVLKPKDNGSIYFSTSKAAVPPGSFLGQGAEDNGLTPGRGQTTVDIDALKVQKTTSYEVGTKWNLLDNNLNLSLALFQTKTVNARTTDANGLALYVGTRRIRGVELSYNGNITDKWNVFGGYTYMPSKILDSGQTVTGGISAPSAGIGRAFPNTPKNSFTTFTNYKITPKLTLGGGAIYMSKVYGGYSDTRAVQNGAVVITKTRATYVPSYWRFDANASYQLTDMVKLQINALNVGNKRYFDKAYAAHYANQAAGRTVLGTISVRY
ncbi:TonB-dependent receptor [Sphingomonas abietis]|uniref:TonB-dependent receptor n=1 Tax=Sphingomonas abietis TaxID=3012344 RepID=A0ABY7NPP7_9SPHN|nr:TonB-dependent receptor [Sphingomonas abietis]WBO22552.1 TonB-dependent receptor [Sphingomonas abietis]